MIKTTILVRVEGDGLSAEATYELGTHEHIDNQEAVDRHANKVLSSLDIVDMIKALADEAVQSANRPADTEDDVPNEVSDVKEAQEQKTEADNV